MLRLKEVKLFLVWLNKPTNLVKRSWRWANLTMQHVLQIFEERGDSYRLVTDKQPLRRNGLEQECTSAAKLKLSLSSDPRNCPNLSAKRGTRGWLGHKWGATVS